MYNTPVPNKQALSLWGSVCLFGSMCCIYNRITREVSTMAEARILTFTDKKKLEEQLAALNEEKKRVAEEIGTAKGFGDLSENAEYDAAKAHEAEVYGNIARIEAELRTATFVDDSNVDATTAALGTVVTVEDLDLDEDDEEKRVDYTLVGFTEVNVDSKDNSFCISNESPIGIALLGRGEPGKSDYTPPARVGDIVEVGTPGGVIRLKVLAIRKR